MLVSTKITHVRRGVFFHKRRACLTVIVSFTEREKKSIRNQRLQSWTLAQYRNPDYDSNSGRYSERHRAITLGDLCVKTLRRDFLTVHQAHVVIETLKWQLANVKEHLAIPTEEEYHL